MSMLKKLIKMITPGRADDRPPAGPHTLASGEHPLKPADVSKGATKVIQVLEENGFQAFAVGGCVRDMLLDLHPKDFDVATDATPEDVKNLFRRARVVGRRFRIAHVNIGRERIEVTTFRAGHDDASHKEADRSDQGMLLRDNVYGGVDEDARRRDFTVNALYYHPGDNTLYDYANGLEDIQQRRLAVIGDAQTRYREDPVRMLRAARFAAKLGFAIDPESARPIPELAPLIADVAPARLFDELLKLLLSGSALATYRLLREHGLFQQLFPLTAPFLEGEGENFYEAFIEQAMVNTDLRIRNNQRVTPAFLLAALLWPPVVAARDEFLQRKEAPAMAMQKAGGRVVAQQVERVAIPRRFSQPMREIWDLQQRLPQRHGNRAQHLVSLPRFRAAYDFVLLREQAGENLDGLGHWWTRYQDADENTRRTMVEALGSPGKGGGRKRRRPRKRRSRKPEQ